MTHVAAALEPIVGDAYTRCDHAIFRGEFPALVFSGDVDVLGELPGEHTASTQFKFAMVDDRLDATRDFARTPHMPLPLWPSHRVEPTPGVCFVFCDEEHPAVHQLQASGGVEHEHFVIAQRLAGSSSERKLIDQIGSTVQMLPEDEMILLLGYGDQGARIGRLLCRQFKIDPGRIAVIDDNADSLHRARHEGHVILDHADELPVRAVIYTPLMRYERLYEIFATQARASMSIDNSTSRRGAGQFRSRGTICLEPAADRAIEVRGPLVKLRPHGLPLSAANIVREDLRMLAGQTFIHLSTGHRANLEAMDGEFDLASPGSADRLPAATFAGMRRAYVSLRDRPDAAVFACRELCSDLWPQATARIFPATCTSDLGSTRFERIIKRHIDGAEMITASQTSAQQVALGVVANQYANSAPIVEIGSALGGSGALMAAATDQNKSAFHSIDPETATRHVMRWGFQQQDQQQRLHQISATSDEAILELHHIRETAGLVFIDGLHTYAAAAADFANYAPLVRPGGALLIHDVEPARYSVLRVVVERVLMDTRFVPKCMIDGLLVLERVVGR